MRRRFALVASLVVIAWATGSIASPAVAASARADQVLLRPAGRFAFDVWASRWSWLEISDLEGADRRAVTATRGARSRVISDVVWTPGGSRLAFLQGRGIPHPDGPKVSIYAVDVDGSDLRRLAGWPQLGRGIGAPVWSADGLHLVFTQNRAFHFQRRKDLGLYVVNADGSGLRKLARAVPSNWPGAGESSVRVDPLGFSPDGSTIFYLWTVYFGDTRLNDWRYAEIYEIDVAGTARRRVARVDPVALDVTLAPDARTVAYVGRGTGGQIHLVDTATGARRSMLDATDSVEIREIAWLPDSSGIAYLANTYPTDENERYTSALSLLNVGLGTARQLTPPALGVLTALTVGRAGGSIGYVNFDFDNRENGRLLHVVSPDGTDLGTFAKPAPSEAGVDEGLGWTTYLE